MKIKPVEVTEEQAQILTEKVQSQDLSTGIPQVLDPKFPIWKYDTLNKHLLYFPNIDTKNHDKELRGVADRTATVGVKLSGSPYFTPLRNTEGIIEEGLKAQGISGSSPLQVLFQKRQELFNLMKNRLYKENGIDASHQADMTDPNDTAVPILRRIGEQIPVDRIKETVIVPVLSISLDQNKGGVNLLLDDEGNSIQTPGWLILSTQTYDKLKKSISNLAEPQIAGNFFIFDYTNDKINANATDARMKCANTMTISHFSNDSLNGFKDQLDEVMKDWTLTKLRNTVTQSVYIADDQLEEMTSVVLDQLESMIATENSLLTGAPQTSNSKEVAVSEESTKTGLADFKMEETSDMSDVTL